MGEKCVELVDMLLKGQPLTFDNPEQREILAPVRLVTRDNIAQVYPAEK